MEIETTFFRLAIALLSKKVSPTFSAAVSKLIFSVTKNIWQKHQVSMKDTPVAAEASYSHLGESNLNSGCCGFAGLNKGTKQTHQVSFALRRSKTTHKEKEEK